MFLPTDLKREHGSPLKLTGEILRTGPREQSHFRAKYLLAKRHDLHSLETVDRLPAVPSLRLPELAVWTRNMIDLGRTHRISLTGATASTDNAVTLIPSEDPSQLVPVRRK